MDEGKNVLVYGDSIMRATVPDENLKYHFRFNALLERYADLPLPVRNRSKFGATIDKGLSTLEADLSRGVTGEYALLEYGGNDCNFDWAAISERPEEEHLPNTSLAKFEQTLETMVERLREAGIRPVLMTLPPIDAERYLTFLCGETLQKGNILKWLGDLNMIYRFQELYSNAVRAFADRRAVPLIDVREKFLARHDFRQLISADGIHLTDRGYEVLFDTQVDYWRAHASV